jgi:hypothetical protein
LPPAFSAVNASRTASRTASYESPAGRVVLTYTWIVPPAQQALVRSPETYAFDRSARTSGTPPQFEAVFAPLAWIDTVCGIAGIPGSEPDGGTAGTVQLICSSKSTLRPLTASDCGAKPWSDPANVVGLPPIRSRTFLSFSSASA